MKTLPNLKRAYVDSNKLENYCSNPAHPVGEHKAIVFRAVLNLQKNDASLLKRNILKALPEAEAHKGIHDNYGTRYIVDVKIRIFQREAEVCTIWIVRTNEDFPRFVTCYVRN